MKAKHYGVINLTHSKKKLNRDLARNSLFIQCLFGGGEMFHLMAHNWCYWGMQPLSTTNVIVPTKMIILRNKLLKGIFYNTFESKIR
jgi:hypothetical protein